MRTSLAGSSQVTTRSSHQRLPGIAAYLRSGRRDYRGSPPVVTIRYPRWPMSFADLRPMPRARHRSQHDVGQEMRFAATLKEGSVEEVPTKPHAGRRERRARISWGRGSRSLLFAVLASLL